MKAKSANSTHKNKLQHHMYSVKAGRFFKLDGPVEKQMSIAFEFDDDIVQYKAQPRSFFNTTEDATWHRYTPDWAVRIRNGEAFYVEGKDEKSASYATTQNKYYQHRSFILREYGTKLELWTPARYSQARFNNAQFLYSYLRQPVSESAKRMLKSINSKQISFAELRAHVINSNLDLSQAFILAAHQTCRWNMENPLTNDTLMEIQP